jgi:hypothetical protein
VHNVAVLLRGNNSAKRKKAHIAACREVGIPYRRILTGGPKWGSEEVEVRRFLDQKEALLKLKPSDIFDKADKV